MKLPSLILPFCSFLSVIFLCLPEARGAQRGILILGQPTQYVDFTYSFQNVETDNSLGPRTTSTSSDVNRIFPGYAISLPFAIYDPDIFLGSANALVRYQKTFVSVGNKGTRESSATKIYYGLTGNVMRKKPVSFSFYANSQQTWVQQEFAPGQDVTTTNYGAEADYKHKTVPAKLKYVHNSSDISNVIGDQSSSYDTLLLQLSHSVPKLSYTGLNIQERWVRYSRGFFTPDTSLNDFSVNLNNALQWEVDQHGAGSLSSVFFFDRLTGGSSLTTWQLNESLTQTLGKALTAGVNYGFSLQQSPLETVRTDSGNIWLNHHLFQSLRTRLNVQGIHNEFANGTNTQITGSAELIYDKKLPRNSSVQLSVSDTYQWNNQNSATQLRTQFNEQVKITDISQRYLLSNPNVFRIVEVWNQDHTVKFVDPADFSIEVVADLTYLVITPTGLIHTGDTLLVTYEYQVDADLTIGSNTVAVSGNLALVGNLVRIFAGYANTQQYLLSGRAEFAALGSRTTWNAGAQSNLADHTFGVRYDVTDAPRLSQATLFSYWRYNKSIGKNRYSLALTDTYSTWDDKVTFHDGDSNAFNAWGTFTRQFTPATQGSVRAGYLMTRGSTRSSDNFYVSLGYNLRLGKLQFYFNGQTLLNDYRQSSTWNNYINLTVRRYF